MSQGAERSSVAQSSSGDLYASHNGNAYKKTDDRWSRHEGGSWQSVDARSGPQSSSTMSRLNRDHSARQAGSRQFSGRMGGMRGGARTRRR